jgi:hypothetical protein
LLYHDGLQDTPVIIFRPFVRTDTRKSDSGSYSDSAMSHSQRIPLSTVLTAEVLFYDLFEIFHVDEDVANITGIHQLVLLVLLFIVVIVVVLILTF